MGSGGFVGLGKQEPNEVYLNVYDNPTFGFKKQIYHFDIGYREGDTVYTYGTFDPDSKIVSVRYQELELQIKSLKNLTALNVPQIIDVVRGKIAAAKQAGDVRTAQATARAEHQQRQQNPTMVLMPDGSVRPVTDPSAEMAKYYQDAGQRFDQPAAGRHDIEPGQVFDVIPNRQFWDTVQRNYQRLLEENREKYPDFWADRVQSGLDAVGLLPVVGIVPNLINAAIYKARGNEVQAAFSILAAIPLYGDLAQGAKMAGRAEKTLQGLSAADKIVALAKEAKGLSGAAKEAKIGELARALKEAEPIAELVRAANKGEDIAETVLAVESSLGAVRHHLRNFADPAAFRKSIEEAVQTIADGLSKGTISVDDVNKALKPPVRNPCQH